MSKTKKLRSCDQISNEISENLPVTKEECLKIIRWHRKIEQELISERNAADDALKHIVIRAYKMINVLSEELAAIVDEFSAHIEAQRQRKN